MAWDVLVRSLFTDSGVSAGLAKLNSQIHDVAKSAPGGTRAFNMMEQGLRTLAFEAVGVQGPIGKVADGLLKFGGGSALVLGATAGIGAVAVVINALERDAREAREATEALITSLDKIGTHAAAVGARIKLSLAQSETERGQGAGGVLQQFLSDMTGGLMGVSGPEQSERRLRAVSAAQGGVGAATARAAEEGAKPLRELQQTLHEINYEVQHFIELNPRFLEGISVPSLKDVLRGDFTKFPSGFDDARLDAALFFAGGTGKSAINDKAGIEAARRRPNNAAAIAAASVALLGATQGGGTGGVISGFGGLLGTIKGIPSPLSIGLTALGGVFSIFDRSEERRHKELIRSIERIGQEVGLERVMVVFTGPDGHQIRRSLAELESSDAVERVPGPVGVSG